MVKINFKRIIKNRCPLLKWLPFYKAEEILGDLVAGVTVGLTLIPQAIAYAGLAGLKPQYGLYSAFVGSFIYIVFGTCREVNIGPTALISLLTWAYARGIPEYTALLCFLSGCITIFLGILRLGFLVEFVSMPVISGFTSAASVIIASSQIKNLLGLDIHGENFIEICWELINRITDTKMPDLILSCCCILILLILKYLKDRKVGNVILKRFLWTIGTARNALVVILSAVTSYIFEMYDGAPFILTGHIDAGLPSIEPPPFSRTIGQNQIALSLLTPYFYYIPKATLSSVIISAVIFMIEIDMILPIWKCNKRDLIPAFVTFFASLFAGVELGILIGTIIDLAILMYLNARPTINIEYRNTSITNYVMIRPVAGILFPAVNHLRSYLTKASTDKCHKSSKNLNTLPNVVLDCEHIDKIDFTVAQSINMLIKDFRDNNCHVIMLRPNPDILKSIQSLSHKQILTAKNEVDLITMLQEFKDATQNANVIEIKASNSKMISETTKGFVSTWL